MPKVTSVEVPKFRRKKPTDYRLVQFRSDEKTKDDLEHKIELLSKILKKDSRFKRFRKNDVYITCLDLGINMLTHLIGDKSKTTDAKIQNLVQRIHIRRELQWANDKTPRDFETKTKKH